MTILGLLGKAPIRLEALTLKHAITISFVMLAIVAVPEELFFRGYVQTRLNDVFGKPFTRIPGFKGTLRYGPSAIITGILFGLLHAFNYINPITGKCRLNPGTAALIAIACFVGVFLSFIREKSGDLICPILFHGPQDITIPLISILNSRSVMFTGLAIGWIVFLIKPFENSSN